jgi:DNA-binding LytR/AlgR family response regulator
VRALIAGDEPLLATDLIRRLARLWPELVVAEVASDGLAARQALQETSHEVAFLDIRMPGLSGLEAARSAPPGCRLVFVTAFDQHALEAFDLAAVDYLLKPVSDERLARCVERLRRTAGPDPAQLQALLERLGPLLPSSPRPDPLRWLRVQAGSGVRLVDVAEVLFFQSTDKYTRAVTREGEFLLRTPIKDLEAQLNPDQFWRVHRGALVNAAHIKAARRDLLGRLTLTLKDHPETLAVSRRYAHLFRQG